MMTFGREKKLVYHNQPVERRDEYTSACSPRLQPSDFITNVLSPKLEGCPHSRPGLSTV